MASTSLAFFMLNIRQLFYAYQTYFLRMSKKLKLAIGMAVIEIAIICTLFARFLTEPDWNIWRTNWFINKAFVLTCFAINTGHRPVPAGQAVKACSSFRLQTI